MGKRLVRQKDGRLALWSTIVDAYTVLDASEDEMRDYWRQRGAERGGNQDVLEFERQVKLLDDEDKFFTKPDYPPEDQERES